MVLGKLTFFCGKMGSGKSTKAREIARDSEVILLSEDDWLASLYPDEINTLESYVKYSNRLKPAIKNLVQSLLTSGTHVVMDFPANTLAQRAWFRGIFTEINAAHELIYLEAANDVCLQQIAKRRDKEPERAATDTLEMFDKVTKYFVEPDTPEGFNIVRLSRNS